MLAHMSATEGKKIDVLRPARGAGSKGQLFPVAQDINRGRLAGVRATGKGNFGNFIFWQIRKSINRGEKAGLPEKRHVATCSRGAYKEGRSL